MYKNICGDDKSLEIINFGYGKPYDFKNIAKELNYIKDKYEEMAKEKG